MADKLSRYLGLSKAAVMVNMLTIYFTYRISILIVSKYFAKLDLSSGHWQLRIDEPDMHKLHVSVEICVCFSNATKCL